MKIFNKKDKKKNEYILVQESQPIEYDYSKFENINSEDNNKDFNDELEKNNQKNIDENLENIANNSEIINDDILIEAKIDLLPSNFVIGYYEGMTLKGLKEYINGYVFKYFNAPNITSYKILKYNSGFIFEIHDGDYKRVI